MGDNHDSITYLCDIVTVDSITASEGDPPADLGAWCDRADEYLEAHEPGLWDCNVAPARDGEAAQLAVYVPGGGYLTASAVLTQPELIQAADLFQRAWQHAWATEAS